MSDSPTHIDAARPTQFGVAHGDARVRDIDGAGRGARATHIDAPRMTDIDALAELDVAQAAHRAVNQGARTAAATLEVALAVQRTTLAAATYSLAATRAAIAFCALGLALPLGGCPRFHGGRLTDAPAGAAFVEVDGVHGRYRDVGTGPAGAVKWADLQTFG